MDRLAIELVDSGVISVNTRGQVSAPSPGLAIIDGEKLLVGVDAAGTARVKPRHLNSRFWENLGTGSLPRPYPGHLRPADLAHAHLMSVWEASGGGADEVFLAIPGLFSREQMGLVLGIAQSCGMPVRGLADVAVAAAVDRAVKARCLHLDLHLHRAVLTVMRHDHELVRESVQENGRVGLVDLYDRWARTIAKRFVRETRFDPLLNAATEQTLYVQLHKQIVGLGDDESTSVTIPSGGRRFTIDLDRQVFADAAADAYSVIEGLVNAHTHDQETTLLLSSRLSGLPGLAEVLQSAENIDVVILHPAAAGSAILNHASSIRSNGPDLRLVTRLPAFDDRPPGAQTISVGGPTGGQRREDGPTHLVIDGVAHRLSERPLAIDVRDGHEAPPAEGSSAGPVTVRLIHGRAVIEAPAEARAFVNDQLIDGPAELLAGDRLRVGANEILLVKTAD